MIVMSFWNSDGVLKGHLGRQKSEKMLEILKQYDAFGEINNSCWSVR